MDMWKKAVDSDRKSKEFERIAENLARDSDDDVGEAEEEEKVSQEQLERKSSEFQKILDVSTEERDRIQRMQVVDRAAAQSLQQEHFLRRISRQRCRNPVK